TTFAAQRLRPGTAGSRRVFAAGSVHGAGRLPARAGRNAAGGRDCVSDSGDAADSRGCRYFRGGGYRATEREKRTASDHVGGGEVRLDTRRSGSEGVRDDG